MCYHSCINPTLLFFMKNKILFIFLLLVANFVSGQKLTQGSIDELKYVKQLNVILNFSKAKYTATLFISKIDNDGELDGYIVIQNTSSKKTIAIIDKIHGEGGMWGSTSNLIGDGMKDAGERFGHFLSKKL